MHFLRFLIAVSLFITFVSCSTLNQTAAEHQQPAYIQATATPDWYNPATQDTITIVAWNVEHFVDQYDNPYINNEREDTPPPNMDKRRRLLAKAIKNLDADIVVFEEFESDSYLQKYAESYFPDMGYEVFTALESADWYMNVVMMSRVPVGIIESYANVNTPIIGQTDENGQPESQTFINNRMWTTDIIVNDSYSFSLTGLHLKAGRGDRNEGWRLGQIHLLRKHLESVMKRNPTKNMLVVGDLNATPKSDEIRQLLGNDNPPLFVDPLANSGSFSHPSDSLFWRIDYMLPNKQMNNELVENSQQIMEPLSREDMIIISDHLPVMAKFTTTDK